MGYMRHHAIVVTGNGYDGATLNASHSKAVELFGARHVSELAAEVTNGYRSFAIFPDGSKEGWDTSDEYDALRRRWIEWARKTRHEDGSGSLDWVEVQYGDDEYETKICDDSDAPLRANGAS